MNDKVIINERASVQLWAVLGSIPTIIGATFWLASIYMGGEANAQDIVELRGKVDAQYSLLLDIRDRVISLESSKGGNARGKTR